jgi:acetyltransferase-like isoleucine patch superfamily enzyme
VTALSVIHPNVELGEGSEVDPFVILGYPPAGRAAGEIVLRIGARSRIRSHTVIYAGSTIGGRLQTGHGALVRHGCTIGDDCSIGSGTAVEFSVTMGNGVRLHSHVFVPEHSRLDDGAWLGPNVVVTNAKFPKAPRAKEMLAGVRVGANAKIGANATLLPGLEVGADALVGAGSVVTRNVEPGTVVAGNPARRVGLVRELRSRETGLLAYATEAPR